MFKTKSFKVCLPMEEEAEVSLTCDIVNFLNNNPINREDIVDIKYAGDNDWIYCTLIWEEWP